MADDTMLRLAGRLQSIHDSIATAIEAVPMDRNLHILDLLAIAKEATRRAVLSAWAKAPSSETVTPSHDP